MFGQVLYRLVRNGNETIKLIMVSKITDKIRKALKNLVNILRFIPFGFCFMMFLEAPSYANAIEGTVIGNKVNIQNVNS